MSDEPIEPPKLIKQDKHLSIAYSILKGDAGGFYSYCLEDDHFYHYKNGYWRAMFDIEFLGLVSEKMHEITRYTIGMRKQIAENFKYIGRQHLDKFNWAELMNLENGMINPYDGSMEDHHVTYYSTIRMPYIFNPDAVCPLWIKTLMEILEGDVKRRDILQEFFGYCLTRETKHHKALLLLGESRSGKSTILHTLRNVIGASNCSSVPLKYISNAQYTAMLINKLVNIDTDVSAKAAEFEAEFKTITSGESVSVNQKYIPAFDFTPYCKIVMAANIFPKITDHSSAFYKRLILIPCDRVFGHEEQNRDLPKQLLTELPGILNWSIEGLKRLTNRGRFEELDFMRDAIEELENENNPCNLFFEDHIEIIMGQYVEKGELYERYKTWANRTNNFVLSAARFSIAVFRKYNKQTPKTAWENKKRIWRNLKYTDFKSEVKKEQVSWVDIEARE